MNKMFSNPHPLPSQFTRQNLESLTNEQLTAALEQLQSTLNERLAPLTHCADDYWQTAMAIIEELRRLGHELYSHDEDHYEGSDKELWGWNYMQSEPGMLQILFNRHLQVSVHWRSIDPLFGVTGQ